MRLGMRCRCHLLGELCILLAHLRQPHNDRVLRVDLQNLKPTQRRSDANRVSSIARATVFVSSLDVSL
eukprot:COSAG04_NODE_1213_length_7716_cov_4.100565_9_plen_68_part_00